MTREDYYETGTIRQVEFQGKEKNLTIEYKLSGKVAKVTCSPSTKGESYGYSLQECQGNFKFNIEQWKPRK